MYPPPRDWETDCPDFSAGAQDRIHRYSGGDTPQGGFSRPSADLPSAPALRVHPHPPQCAHWGTFPLEGGRLGGRSGVPPLRRPLNHSGRADLGPVQRVETCPLIRLAFARHLPPRGRLSGDRKGRPYGGYGSSSIFLVGAGPRPARQDSYRERWLGKPRRRYWTAPAAIFAPPGPSGPVGIQTDHSDFARRKRCTAYQEAVPRNGVRGKRPMGLGGA